MLKSLLRPAEIGIRVRSIRIPNRSCGIYRCNSPGLLVIIDDRGGLIGIGDHLAPLPRPPDLEAAGQTSVRQRRSLVSSSTAVRNALLAKIAITPAVVAS